MKIMILEDNIERVKSFKKMLKDHELTITDRSDDAIKLVKDSKYDFIFLDHDLGGEQYVDSKEYDTGFRVACAIPSSVNEGTDVIIHSFNPVGAKNMQNILPNARCMPFGTFNENTILEMKKDDYEQLRLMM